MRIKKATRSQSCCTELGRLGRLDLRPGPICAGIGALRKSAGGAGNHCAARRRRWPRQYHGDRGGRKPHRRVLAHSRRRGNQFYCRCRSPDTCWHSASRDFRSAVLLAHDGVLVVTDRDRNAPGIPVGAMSSAALAGLKLGQVRKSLRAHGRASGLLSARLPAPYAVNGTTSSCVRAASPATLAP